MVLFPPPRKSAMQRRLDLEIPPAAPLDERLIETLTPETGPSESVHGLRGERDLARRMPLNIAPSQLWPEV